MGPADRVLGWVGRSGALPETLRPLLRRATGFEQVATRRDTVEALLGADAASVPYGPASAALGLGAFPLALDGAAHRGSRALIGQALAESGSAHGEGVAVGRAVAAAVAGPARRVDVTAEVIDPALTRWAETWFGLPGLGPSMLAVSRLVTVAIFFNPAAPRQRRDAATEATARRAVEDLVEQLIAAGRGAPEGTLAAAVVRLRGDERAAAALLVGLTVGPLALGSWALTLAVADLLSRPPGLDLVTDPRTAQRAYRSAVARTPPLSGLPRRLGRPLGVRSGRRTVVLPAGPVLAHTTVAGRLDPPDDPAAADLAFGAGTHRCMGPDEISAISGEILQALAARRPRLPPDTRRPIGRPERPSGVRHWPFPGPLLVDLAPDGP